jgi:quercetin dioxygenase-like cupin family protein
MIMRKFASALGLSAAFITSFTMFTHAQAPNKPVQILETVVNGMPEAAQQQVRVLTATMQPGEKSVRHTHPFPVTIYVMQGALTLLTDGKPTIVAKAGEAIVEQSGMAAVAANTSATDVTKVVLFYASQPNTPFLVPVGMR